MKLTERWKQESKQMVPADPSKQTNKSADFEIFKTDEDQRLVFGWASVAITVSGETLEDRQHDMIDPEDLEEAAYEYVLNFRDTGEEHLPGYRKKGKLVESCVFTPEKQRAMGIPAGTLPVAWWIGFKIEDDDTWQRVKNGTYRMFSIEGKAEREPVEKAAYDEWLEENMDKFSSEEEEIKFREWKSSSGFRARTASDVDEIDQQWDEYKRAELKKTQTARTFEEVLKFNPYHGYHGYFASANSAGAFAPLRGKTENGQRLLDHYKETHGGTAGGSGGSTESKKPAEHKMAEGKDLLETMDPKKVGKMTTEEVLAAQGFDGKPKVVTSMDEFSKAVQDNGNIACRGIGADDDMTVDAYVDQLKNGDFYVKCMGGNAMGRGMYMATSWNGTNDYDDAFTEATIYGEEKPRHRVVNMTLDKSAKTIEWNDLWEMAKKEGKNLGSTGISGPTNWSPNNTARDDIGAYAAAKGYDAITRKNFDNYTVVLNRTKLVILDQTGHVDDMDGGVDMLFDGAVPF